jgi:hypothetical protein
MIDEPPRKPNGKRVFLVPINPDYPRWLANAQATITAVSRQTPGRLQMRGVGINKNSERDPQSLLAIQGSDLGSTVWLFCSLGWLKSDGQPKNEATARLLFGRFLEFTQNIAGGDGVIVGDAYMLEVITAIAGNTWPPKEPGGCSLICISIDTGDRVTGVERTLDPSADPQRRLALTFKS